MIILCKVELKYFNDNIVQKNRFNTALPLIWYKLLQRSFLLRYEQK